MVGTDRQSMRRNRANRPIADAIRMVHTGEHRAWLFGLAVVAATGAATLPSRPAMAAGFVCNQNESLGLGGGNSVTTAASAVACGIETQATADEAVAFGNVAIAAGVQSTAVGFGAQA
jgi:hypothetical protein